MPSLNIDQIQGVIWDLDNTLYRFDEAFEKACSIASGRAAVTLGVPLKLEEAVTIAEEAFYKFGYSGIIFERDYKICREEYHFAYHKAIDEKIVQRNQEMCDLMEAFDHPHVILTNASKDWAIRILKHLSMDKFFPEERIIAQEDAQFESKAGGPRGFQMAIEKLNLPPANILMVDDMVKNLRIPKELGLQTAYIHHGLDEGIEHFVDEAFPDTIALMKRLIQLHPAPSQTYSEQSS